jgi:beta-apo-4'-carotenal oxygenase
MPTAAESSPSTYTNTRLDAIPKIASSLRYTFASHKTKPIKWRLQQLRKLYWSFIDNQEGVMEALKKDLNKHPLESYMAEFGWVINDILYVCDNLEKWAKDEKAADIPLQYMALGAHIRKDPLGAVLIIGYVWLNCRGGLFTAFALVDNY